MCRVSSDEVKYDSLHQTLDSNLTVILDQTEESFLVLGPKLYYISFALEQTAKEDIILVLGCDI